MANLGRKRILVTVKAYPSIGKKYGEAICVAGIDQTTNDWIRLYPVAFRDLPQDHRFAKYATIEVESRKSKSDPRPESYTPLIDTLKVTQGPLPSGVAQERRELILPLIKEGMCSILAQQKVDGISLGLFEPAELLAFRWERTAEHWSEGKRMKIDQQSLLGGKKPPLQKIPFAFSYRYRCSISGCRGHTQKIVDWEIGEMFRSLRLSHDERSALEKVRQKWADQLWGSKYDTYLYVGNQLAHPKGFLVLGVFWPKKRTRGDGSSGWVQGELPLQR